MCRCQFPPPPPRPAPNAHWTVRRFNGDSIAWSYSHLINSTYLSGTLGANLTPDIIYRDGTHVNLWGMETDGNRAIGHYQHDVNTGALVTRASKGQALLEAHAALSNRGAILPSGDGMITLQSNNINKWSVNGASQWAYSPPSGTSGSPSHYNLCRDGIFLRWQVGAGTYRYIGLRSSGATAVFDWTDTTFRANGILISNTLLHFPGSFLDLSTMTTTPIAGLPGGAVYVGWVGTNLVYLDGTNGLIAYDETGASIGLSISLGGSTAIRTTSPSNRYGYIYIPPDGSGMWVSKMVSGLCVIEYYDSGLSLTATYATNRTSRVYFTVMEDTLFYLLSLRGFAMNNAVIDQTVFDITAQTQTDHLLIVDGETYQVRAGRYVN